MADWSKVKVETAYQRRKKRISRMKQEKELKEKEQKKKQAVIGLLVVGIVMIAIISVSVIWGTISSREKEQKIKEKLSGVISVRDGKVKVYKKGIGFFENYEEGMVLEGEEAIRMEGKGTVTVKFKNGVDLKLVDKSEVALKKIELKEPENLEDRKLNLEMEFKGGTAVLTFPKSVGSLSIDSDMGRISFNQSIRTIAKLTTADIPDKKMNDSKALRIVVKSGKVDFRNALGTKSERIKNFQELYVWKQHGRVTFNKAKEVNPATEKF